jgi:hypothetical protein
LLEVSSTSFIRVITLLVKVRKVRAIIFPQ